MSEFFGLTLPDGNQEQFDLIETNLKTLGVKYERYDSKLGDCTFIFEESEIPKLPKDSKGHFVPVERDSGFSFWKFSEKRLKSVKNN